VISYLALRRIPRQAAGGVIAAEAAEVSGSAEPDMAGSAEQELIASADSEIAQQPALR
jgi:hypothetical protein